MHLLTTRCGSPPDPARLPARDRRCGRRGGTLVAQRGGRCRCDNGADPNDPDCGYCGFDQSAIQFCTEESENLDANYDKLKCLNETDPPSFVPNPCPPWQENFAFAARSAAVAESGSLTVALIDGNSRAPIGGAVFELYQDGSLIQTSSDPENSGYTFFGELATGSYTLVLLVAPNGTITSDTPIVIVAGENTVIVRATTTAEEPTTEPTQAPPTQEPTPDPTEPPPPPTEPPVQQAQQEVVPTEEPGGDYLHHAS